MKITAAVLALLAVTVSAAPVMASVADSSGTNAGAPVHKAHHHHHRRHHRLMEEIRGDDAVQTVSSIN